MKDVLSLSCTDRRPLHHSSCIFCPVTPVTPVTPGNSFPCHLGADSCVS